MKPQKKTINPPTLFNSSQFGFSQIVTAASGRHVFISGQVSNDENGKIIGVGDLAMQIDRSFQNLDRALQSVGGTMVDVVMLRLYMVNYQRADGSMITAALKKYFPMDPPASTWLSVQGLANPDFLVEVEAQAVLSK